MEAKSLFIEFMGDSPRIRVLDYLLTERELDFSKNNIIIHTRIIGKAKLFRLNTSNTKIKKLIQIFLSLINEERFIYH